MALSSGVPIDPSGASRAATPTRPGITQIQMCHLDGHYRISKYEATLERQQRWPWRFHPPGGKRHFWRKRDCSSTTSDSAHDQDFGAFDRATFQFNQGPVRFLKRVFGDFGHERYRGREGQELRNVRVRNVGDRLDLAFHP